MNRAAVATWIGNRYGAYLAAVGRTTADTAANLQPILDDALLALGYADADVATANPIEQGAITDFKVMAAYYTMAQIVRDLGALAINVTTEDGRYELNQQRAAAEKDLAAAELAVLARGLSLYPIADDAIGVATINYNFLAPTWSDWA